MPSFQQSLNLFRLSEALDTTFGYRNAKTSKKDTLKIGRECGGWQKREQSQQSNTFEVITINSPNRRR